MALTDEDKEWIAERLERTVVRLLSAFYQWASPIESRTRRHREAIHDLEVELDALARRVNALEEASA
jgi:hypothetical protein